MPVPPINIFSSTIGINNSDAPTEVAFNRETGNVELVVGMNVDVTMRGKIQRRKGYYSVSSKSYHNFYNVDNKFCVCTSRSNPGVWSIARKDGSNIAFADLNKSLSSPELKISYSRSLNNLYWSNSVENGIIDLKKFESKDTTSFYGWEYDGNYIGPKTGKALFSPPPGHIIFIFKGRMYVVQDSVIWYSEPFSFSQFRMATNFVPFKSRIRMVAPTREGMFVSDESDTYFVRGVNPKEFQLEHICSYPAVERTLDFIKGDNFNADIIKGASYAQDGDSALVRGDTEGDVAIWGSGNGICLGFSDGRFRNLTKKQLVYQSKPVGASVVDGDRFICIT